jgi:hypothetical protein
VPRAAVLPDRDAFFLPRVNAAWDINGDGNNVIRGGYGMFYNRYQGNFEYDAYLRLAPNAYNVGVGYTDAKSYGMPFLSFDNVRQINSRSESEAWGSSRHRRTRSAGRRPTASAPRTRGASRGTRC